MADFRLGRLKFKWRGSWTASTAYVIDDIVKFVVSRIFVSLQIDSELHNDLQYQQKAD